MKKTSLLSLLTAGAIVATSAGTYAVWDQMEATASGYTVTLDKAVMVKAETINFDSLLTSDTPAKASIKVTPTNFSGTGKIKLEAVTNPALPKGVSIEFEDNEEPAVAMPSDGFAVNSDVQKTYNVVVSFNTAEITKEEVATISGQQISFDVKATLTETK